ncbi:hypothetical protein AB0J72_28455 [Dactylosporangium sp. NPDC049742]|uniref:hypothetical protein n=1 Tax=Dactylosporangium sp. NPDC049742 TaxID=3154737 RepID=UPI003423CE55
MVGQPAGDAVEDGGVDRAADFLVGAQPRLRVGEDGRVDIGAENQGVWRALIARDEPDPTVHYDIGDLPVIAEREPLGFVGGRERASVREWVEFYG